jgi:hypothetical protein
VRYVLALAAFLTIIVQWSCQMDALAVDFRVEQVEWVRTVNGWEPLESLSDRPRHRPSLHPMVVAALETLSSMFALAAFSATRGQAGRP